MDDDKSTRHVMVLFETSPALGDTPTGTVTCADSSQLSFAGWLELLAALETVFLELRSEQQSLREA